MKKLELKDQIKDEGFLPELGLQLQSWRKLKYPYDSMKTFAFRVGVSRSTYLKMEKGDLSVSIRLYLQAACLLNIEDRITELFTVPQPKPRLGINITKPYENLFEILHNREERNLFDELDAQRSKREKTPGSTN